MKTAFLATALVLASAALSVKADAQRTSDTYYACYAPPSGVVYRIRSPGAPAGCVEADHIEFSWTSSSVGAGKQPSGGNSSQGGGGAPTVPAGAVMFFDLAACPAGWTVLDAARGRAIVGLPDGGMLQGVVGTALTDRESRPHSHAIDASHATTAAGGAHTHSIEAVSVVSALAGDHNHIWATKSSADIWRDGLGQQLVDWSSGMSNDGGGQFPISTSSEGSLTVRTSTNGSHAHQVQIPTRVSAESGDHAHDVVIPGQSSASAGTADVMPYIQLLACRKS